MNDTTPSYRAIHILTILTVIASYPLIFMGGLVTTKGAGMAVPDWPNSFGYNMFLLPWEIWRQGGIFYEHTHRLLGTVVGFMTMVVLAVAWWPKLRDRETRPGAARIRKLALVMFIAVCFQGVLGGLRVIWNNLDLAVVHGCFAQLFLCIAVTLATISSGWWQRQTRPTDAAQGNRLPIIGLIAFTLVFAQLVVGAVMRHDGAGLAVPDLPLHYGKVIPPTNADELAEANRVRTSEPMLGRVTLWQIWIHVAHRFGAVVVTSALLYFAIKVWRRARRSDLSWPAGIMTALLAVQLLLGILTVLQRKPADIATLHVAVGAMLLSTTFWVTLRTIRIYWLADAADGNRGFSVDAQHHAGNPVAVG